MGVIYKITNKVNNKIYIGKTVLTEPQRWQQHLYYLQNNLEKKDCPYLCNAILKYGKENFSREILEQVDNSKLFEREKYWIKNLTVPILLQDIIFQKVETETRNLKMKKFYIIIII